MTQDSTYRDMTARLAGRYGLPVVMAKEQLAHLAGQPGYWKAVYNRAVDIADWARVAP